MGVHDAIPEVLFHFGAFVLVTVRFSFRLVAFDSDLHLRPCVTFLGLTCTPTFHHFRCKFRFVSIPGLEKRYRSYVFNSVPAHFGDTAVFLRSRSPGHYCLLLPAFAFLNSVRYTLPVRHWNSL